jgi:hypothetical protein
VTISHSEDAGAHGEAGEWGHSVGAKQLIGSSADELGRQGVIRPSARFQSFFLFFFFSVFFLFLILDFKFEFKFNCELVLVLNVQIENASIERLYLFIYFFFFI